MRERLAWVDSARGLALALVVLLHTTAWLEHFGFPVSRWILDANAILDGFRMPTLVLISGMLAAKTTAWPWREVMRRRVGPLLLLYVVWALIVVFAIHWFVTGAPGFEPDTLVGLFLRPEQRVWYFYALAAYIALGRLLRSVPTIPLLVIAVAVNLVAMGWLLGASLPLDLQWWGYVLEHWVFFVAAERFVSWYLRIAERPSLRVGITSLVVFAAYGVAVLALGVITNALVTLTLGVLGSVMTLTLFPALGSRRGLGWARAVGRHSLGVYAMHAAIAAGVASIVVPILPRFPGAGTLMPAAVVGVVVAISYAITVALERWTPVPLLRPWWDIAARAALPVRPEPATRAE